MGIFGKKQQTPADALPMVWGDRETSFTMDADGLARNYKKVFAPHGLKRGGKSERVTVVVRKRFGVPWIEFEGVWLGFIEPESSAGTLVKRAQAVYGEEYHGTVGNTAAMACVFSCRSITTEPFGVALVRPVHGRTSANQ
jgi:hypothetical protein